MVVLARETTATSPSVRKSGLEVLLHSSPHLLVGHVGGNGTWQVRSGWHEGIRSESQEPVPPAEPKLKCKLWHSPARTPRPQSPRDKS